MGCPILSIVFEEIAINKVAQHKSGFAVAATPRARINCRYSHGVLLTRAE